MKYNVKNINLIEEYKENSNISNRFVGVGILKEAGDIEYNYFPDTAKLKLIIPSLKIKYDILLDKRIEYDNEFVMQDEIVKIIKKFIKEKNVNIGKGFETKKREFMRNGFIHVPKKFLFNHQETSDNVVITKNPNTNEYGIILIDRKLPPTGWAMAGGMVEEGQTSEENSEIELKEELGEKMKSKKIKSLPKKIYTYELRGSLNTLVTIYYSSDGYTNAIAGDDASDSIFITMSEIKKLLKNGNINYKGKNINLIPHHKEILKKVFLNLSKDDEFKKLFI